MISTVLLKQVKRELKSIGKKDFRKFAKYFLQDKRIFVVGAGRSGLVGKFFAMRLMHLGNSVFVLGETNTPSIKGGDILLAISASGSTNSVVNAADAAKKFGATVLAVTANPKGELAKLSDYTVLLDNSDKKKREKKVKKKDREIPLGTLFEVSSLLYLETLVSEIMHISGIEEETMKARHVNI